MNDITRPLVKVRLSLLHFSVDAERVDMHMIVAHQE